MSRNASLTAFLLLVLVTTAVGVLVDRRGSGDGEGGGTESDVAIATATAPRDAGPAPTSTPAPGPNIQDVDRDTAALLERLTSDPLLAEFAPGRAALAHYRRALALRDAGDIDAAALSFGLAALREGSLGAMARLRLAQALAAGHRDEDAVRVFALAIDEPALTPALRRIARLEAAAVLERLERPAEATTLLEAVIADPAAAASEAARAHADLARLQQADNDPGWVDHALAAVAAAPGLAPGMEALDALEAASVAVPPLDAAYARYRAFQNAEAIANYEQVIAAPASDADAAVAWFYLGALAERDFADDAAIEAYGQSLAHDPRGHLAADAHWWRGRLLEQAGLPEEATAEYQALAAGFPGAPYAGEAALRAAVILADRGASVPARLQLRALAANGPPADAAMALRWLQVLGLATEDDPAPATADPASIWALLDEAGGDAGAPLPVAAAAEGVPLAADQDVPGPDGWLTMTFGAPPPGGGEAALRAEPALMLGLALAAAGEDTVGRGLLLDLVSVHADDPYALYALAQIASAAELHDVALRAASTILGNLDAAERLAAHPAVARLAYPVPFVAEVEAAAAAAGIPPLLLLALVRQESAFHPGAGSIAAAYGLTQVIAATGEQIAAELGEPWPADLFDPAVSLRFGAHYLGRQLDAFDGDIFAALAAYNGGPSNAQRWRDVQAYPGIDGYLYAVDFTETRRYLEQVAENYAWYRSLYAGTDAPALR